MYQGLPYTLCNNSYQGNLTFILPAVPLYQGLIIKALFATHNSYQGNLNFLLTYSTSASRLTNQGTICNTQFISLVILPCQFTYSTSLSRLTIHSLFATVHIRLYYLYPYLHYVSGLPSTISNSNS